MTKLLTSRRYGPLVALVAAALPLSTQAQLAVPAGSTLSVSSGSTLSVTGAVLNAGTLSNEGTVQLTGNLSSIGILSGTTGQLKLTGTSTPQTLNVTSLVPALEILNPQGATLAGPLRVRQLALTGGAVRLGAHILTSTTGGSITGVDGAAGRFIITDGAGMLQQQVGTTARLFPVGASATSYAPATLARSAGSGLYELRPASGFLSNGSTGTPLTTDAVGLHWELTPPDAVPFTLTVQWQTADELSNFTRAQSALGRWNGTAYGLEEAFGPVGGAPPYSRTVSGLTNAGPYVVLDRQAPLPVELTRFEATRPTGQPRVLLNWTTASEQDNAGFEVQRQDEGQTTFRRVGFVAGRGTTSAAAEYTFQDPNDFRGLSYYRLRQLDQNGTESFSPVRTVAGLAGGASFSVAVYPNPVAPQGILTLEATGPLPAGLQLTLYAADGRVVRRFNWPTGQAQHKLSADLPAGAYWLRYHAPNGTAGTLPMLVSE
ncbi:T9SS type A sorting domain-containing protein [Hymenobacter norwichensis]|uniref:T9SS type A sorting domain-containing protein n=1 Tax=Hymenobacter norwichensis TaxID=223903 RepID=UPI0003B37204|nr:T9SS type A sorting domain-containing protein [Hymenobacter norwichensis]